MVDCAGPVYGVVVGLGLRTPRLFANANGSYHETADCQKTVAGWMKDSFMASTALHRSNRSGTRRRAEKRQRSREPIGYVRGPGGQETGSPALWDSQQRRRKCGK
ncbi:hypothetical protein MRX96_015673 [Rhipicephalus microplus]